MDIIDYFPFKTFRTKQKEILTEFQDNWDSYDFFMLEAPTGFGKSAVAYTIAKWIQGERGGYSHILASNKFLQEQYLRDFDDIALVKGRSNFSCPRFVDRDCGNAPCTYIKNFRCSQKPYHKMANNAQVRDHHGQVYDWSKATEPLCPYWIQKDDAVRSDLTIHNYHYYLYEQNLTAGAFNKRYLGVFDEAHMIEKILMDFTKTRLSRRSLNTIYKVIYPNDSLNFPRHDTAQEWVVWLRKLANSLINLGSQIEFKLRMEKTDRFSMIYLNTIEKVTNLADNMDANPDQWVWDIDIDTIDFKPISIGDYSGYLFDHVEKKLLMSATILNDTTLKRFLGIKEDVYFCEVPESTFPVNNRPLYQKFIGKAVKYRLQDYLRDLVDTLDNDIIPTRLMDKGVIHTHTNDIAKYIMERSKYSVNMTTTVGRDRETAIQNFFKSSSPRIMVSPSMTEGVDLMDDICRWQVITKIPYPYMGDKQVRARMAQDRDWYNWQTIMTVIQTYGRGCRSATDWCDTIVTDSKFEDVIQANWKSLPKWFKEAIRV